MKNEIPDFLRDIFSELSELEMEIMKEDVQMKAIAYAIILTNGSRNARTLAKVITKFKNITYNVALEAVKRLYPKMVEEGQILDNGTLTMKETVDAIMYQKKIEESESENEYETSVLYDPGTGMTSIPHLGPNGEA